jgi:hypothetical protein
MSVELECARLKRGLESSDEFTAEHTENVQVGQSTSVNLRLQPGAGSESITVIGESPLLRTEESDLSSVVNREDSSAARATWLLRF